MPPSPVAPAKGDDRLKAVMVTMKRHQTRPSALLEVLHTVQEVYGYLPKDLLQYVARQLRLPLSRVYGVATFYHFFTLKPRGEHTCVVCLGTACYIKDAPGVLHALEQSSGVPAGQTTPDGRVSLQTARCLGACGLAPAIIYDGKIVGHQTPDLAKQQIEGWLHGSS